MESICADLVHSHTECSDSLSRSPSDRLDLHRCGGSAGGCWARAMRIVVLRVLCHKWLDEFVTHCISGAQSRPDSHRGIERKLQMPVDEMAARRSPVCMPRKADILAHQAGLFRRVLPRTPGRARSWGHGV
jgi:hypothetical protein